MSKLTFYPDISKQKEFINKLNSILYKENSSIKDCYLTYNYTYHLELYLSSFKDSKHAISFNFYTPFTRHEKNHPECFSSIIRQGFSIEDAELLYELFQDFTLSNGAESQFFASKFKELSGHEDDFLRYAFKFTEDIHEDKFIIDGLKLTRTYACLRKEDILRFLVDEELNINEILTPINGYSLISDDTKDECAQQMINLNKHNPDDEYIVIELYRNFETKERYVKDITYQVGDELITNNFKFFI